MILALDFDGVLHSAAADDALLFQNKHLIWQILRARQLLEVVLSTSWRGTHPHEELVTLVTQGGGEDHRKPFSRNKWSEEIRQVKVRAVISRNR